MEPLRPLSGIQDEPGPLELPDELSAQLRRWVADPLAVGDPAKPDRRKAPGQESRSPNQLASATVLILDVATSNG